MTPPARLYARDVWYVGLHVPSSLNNCRREFLSLYLNRSLDLLLPVIPIRIMAHSRRSHSSLEFETRMSHIVRACSNAGGIDRGSGSELFLYQRHEVSTVWLDAGAGKLALRPDQNL